MLYFLFFLLLNINPVTQPEQLFVASDSLFDRNGIINLAHRDGWRFHPGDDMKWANPDFDDSNWISFSPAGLREPIPDSLWNGYGWFRYRFKADSSAYSKITHLYFSTYGAAEVYLNGNLVKKHGVFSISLSDEKRFMSANRIFPIITLHPEESNVLAVRFSYHKGKQYKELLGKYAGTFGFNVGLGTDYFSQKSYSRDEKAKQEFYILGTMLLLIVLLHGFLFMLFPAERSNLYITVVSLLLFLHVIVSYGGLLFEYDIWKIFYKRYVPYVVLFLAALSMFPLTLNSMFKQKPQNMHKILIWVFPFFALTNIILSGPGINLIVVIIFISLVLFFASQVLVKAWQNKQKGVWIVTGSFLCLIFSALATVLYQQFSHNFRIEYQAVLHYITYGSIPLGLTAFMASRFRDLYSNLEQKVIERTRELNQSLENLRSTQSQLIASEKLASLGALTAGIAHEIQNPLNFVNNFSDINKELLLELKEDLAEGNKHLAAGSWQSLEKKLKTAEEIANDVIGNEEKINHHGKRADGIVKGMLLHSRGNSGKQEPTDINSLCDKYLRLSYHGLRAKDKSFNADFHTDFDPNLPNANVVPQDMGRVLLNLINNAFDAVHEKSKTIAVETLHATSLQTTPLPQTQPQYTPTVTVTTKNLGDRIEIAVKDNGPGIPEEIREKIFQPFFTTKPAGHGTGLGLSLSYDIVKAHGGSLNVCKVNEQGSCFTVNIPVE